MAFSLAKPPPQLLKTCRSARARGDEPAKHFLARPPGGEATGRRVSLASTSWGRSTGPKGDEKSETISDAKRRQRLKKVSGHSRDLLQTSAQRDTYQVVPLQSSSGREDYPFVRGKVNDMIEIALMSQPRERAIKLAFRSIRSEGQTQRGGNER